MAQRPLLVGAWEEVVAQRPMLVGAWQEVVAQRPLLVGAWQEVVAQRPLLAGAKPPSAEGHQTYSEEAREAPPWRTP